MHKILSVLSLAGFIVSSIKADATAFQGTNQQPALSAASDTPQTSYVPAATNYQGADTLTVSSKLTGGIVGQ
jgi:hypothetical protein